MCCDDEEVLDLPPAVIEALAHYRRLVDERGWNWGGEDLPDLFRWARFSRIGDVFAAVAKTGDWPAAVRSVVGDEPPAGIVRLRVTDGAVDAHTGPPRLAVSGRPVPLDVVVDSEATTAVTLRVADREVTVAPGAAAIETVDLDGAALEVVHEGTPWTLTVDALRPVDAGTLLLTSDDWSRWSVVDPTGGAWFPDGVPPKWDAAHRPFFHARDVTLAVPAAPLTVTCARGVEYDPVTADVHPEPGAATTVELHPARLVDPAGEGWHGGDLHVHLNYGGDLVLTPEQGRAMQRGEGLALMNLTAGNLGGALVYDRELLEHTVGHDLWAGGGHVARASVEFRNDLLGHLHGLGPTSPPARYQTGHAATPHPHDWPPNAVACADLRDRDASVAYAHPVFAPFADDGSVETMFPGFRIPEARELVADAALGLVDSVDVVSCWTPDGAASLYHRLLGCGLRLPATAGSDVFLSFAHGPGVASNPPGWGRMYAYLGEEALSVETYRAAIRAGRTTVTNGPFLTVTVNGAGPGAVLDAARGDRLDVRARVRGPGAEHVELVGPDGVLATADGDGLATTIEVHEPLWLAAQARGGPHPMAPDQPVFAHTSPVYVDVAGARVGRAADARWCLAFLERLEREVTEHGRFDEHHRDTQLGDLLDVIERARAVYRAVAPGL